ncbi:oligoribonuclease [Psychromonas sp. B3M02]|uniref:oligoribonuclease n=1 Tax=Psychromonas sp. B3M02 TaxID=2267226 RepID=UPI000DEAF23F|nr:oligoribonuclease [Psychromonas sp. B3M02]RBW47318.1 oligoribonuclease [Psychromonas sp. B3M02]
MNKDNLVWIDLEMTGLNPDTDKIIEIATIVTDSDLNILAEGPQFVIHQSDAALDAMDEWCTEHHGNSGLTARVKASDISCEQAEQATLDFLKEWVPAGAAPLCGNSIGQDRRFMVRHMPTLEAFFHYRSIDVSTIKELGRRWAPEMVAAHKKTGTHLALQDIKESISELQHYQKHFFSY